MKTKTQIVLTLFTIVYLLGVAFMDISLTGFWTDVIFALVLVSVVLMIGLKRKTENIWLTRILKGSSIMAAICVYGILLIGIINPFAWDVFQMENFHYQKIKERSFHAYFKPVGAYAGGEGNFWITESPSYFPFIEVLRFYEPAVSWNFKATEFDGKPVDQEEMVRQYILDEVIAKEN